MTNRRVNTEGLTLFRSMAFSSGSSSTSFTVSDAFSFSFMVKQIRCHHLIDRPPFFRSHLRLRASEHMAWRKMVQNKKKETRQKLRSIFHVHKLNTFADNVTKTWDDNDPQTRWTWGHFQQDGQGYNRPPLASPHPPVIQSFAVDYTAPLSTHPFNPAMRGTQRGGHQQCGATIFHAPKALWSKTKGNRTRER